MESHRVRGSRRVVLLVGAAALLALLVIPTAAAGVADSADPRATASASVKKQVKKLKRKLNQLTQQVEELQSGAGSPSPPSGGAGGDLAGSYPNPSIRTGAVNSAKVADGTLGGIDILDGSLDTPDLADSAVTRPKIANNAVNGPKVQNGSLGTAEFAGSIPAARVTRSADQTVSNLTDTSLAFNLERYDTANMHDNAVNNSRLTAPVTGVYAITAQVRWDANTVGTRSIEVRRLNSGTSIALDLRPAESGAFQELTTQARLQAGEVVDVQVFQNSGGSRTIFKAIDYSPEFSMNWIAPG